MEVQHPQIYVHEINKKDQTHRVEPENVNNAIVRDFHLNKRFCEHHALFPVLIVSPNLELFAQHTLFELQIVVEGTKWNKILYCNTACNGPHLFASTTHIYFNFGSHCLLISVFAHGVLKSLNDSFWRKCSKYRFAHLGLQIACWLSYPMNSAHF